MSILNKILNRISTKEIGSFKKTSGEYTNTPQESIDYLMYSHFPESVPLNGHHNISLDTVSDEMSNISNDNLSLFDKSVFKKPNEAKICMSEELKSSFINFQTVKAAIFSFKPTKTGGGEDEF